MRRVDYGPLDYIGLDANDESQTPPMLVLCRAPADDGWLTIEATTGYIYNLFDSVAHRYHRIGKSGHRDFIARSDQVALLARGIWFHRPAGIETVGAPRVPRRRRAAA
jgi:hypothetical protein